MEGMEKNIKEKRKGETNVLNWKLKMLSEAKRIDDTIVEIIDAKLHLNWEMEKEEVY